jgi:uncharacterized membrane protein YhdT
MKRNLPLRSAKQDFWAGIFVLSFCVFWVIVAFATMDMAGKLGWSLAVTFSFVYVVIQALKLRARIQTTR